jgi:hypothetical protein
MSPALLTKPPVLTVSERQQARGRRLLFLLASQGHAAQEMVKPLVRLEAAGCIVTLATLDGGEVEFDPLCNAFACARAWPAAAASGISGRYGRFRKQAPWSHGSTVSMP